MVVTLERVESTLNTERRRHDRYPIRLPVEIGRGKRTLTGHTEDVSLSGLYVFCPAPPPLRELVRMQIQLPDGRPPLQLMGMAIHVVPANDPSGRPPGIGLQLFGNDPETKERWSRFVGTIRASSAPKPGPQPVRELQARKPRTPELRIAPRSIEDLESAYQLACSGALTVRTDVFLDAGRKVELSFVHPTTRKTLTLRGSAGARVQTPGFEGLTVELTDFSELEREQFLDFIADDVYITIELELDEPSELLASNG